MLTRMLFLGWYGQFVIKRSSLVENDSVDCWISVYFHKLIFSSVKKLSKVILLVWPLAEFLHCRKLYFTSYLSLFRTLVIEMTQKEDQVLVLSYSRKVLGQTGDGHFSPVGGYHPERDLVLILDTARFKYPPHWVSLRLIWEAMLAHDKSTGQSDGGQYRINLWQTCATQSVALQWTNIFHYYMGLGHAKMCLMPYANNKAVWSAPLLFTA